MRPIDADMLKSKFANFEMKSSDEYSEQVGEWILKNIIPDVIDEIPTLNNDMISSVTYHVWNRETGKHDVFLDYKLAYKIYRNRRLNR